MPGSDGAVQDRRAGVGGDKCKWRQAFGGVSFASSQAPLEAAQSAIPKLAETSRRGYFAEIAVRRCHVCAEVGLVVNPALKSLEPQHPLLRWAGSKRKLLPRLLPYWEATRTRYIEPFVGSGALFFAAAPAHAVLADLNGELIHMYRTVRNNADRVAKHLAAYSSSRETYLRVRAQAPAELSSTQRAARFIYLNRHCFNGLFRTNRKGQFNVPYAPCKTGAIPDRDHLRRAASLLKNAVILHGDFEKVVTKVTKPGDFVYMDPPFAVANRRLFRQYNRNTFGLDDLDRLVTLLRTLDKLGAHFVLSYAVCSESLAAFSHWRVRRVLTQRNIAGFAAHRRRAAELIVTNIELTRR